MKYGCKVHLKFNLVTTLAFNKSAQLFEHLPFAQSFLEINAINLFTVQLLLDATILLHGTYGLGVK